MLESLGVLNLYTYALGALILVLAPGPNSLFVLKTSIQSGERKALQASSAVFLGDAVLIFCAYIGIASLLQAHPALFTAVRWAGAAYLAWLGGTTLWSTYRKKTAAASGEPEAAPAPEAASRPFRTALILSITNPKAILFYVSFFVQFIDPAYPSSWVPYLILASILEAISIVYMTSLSFAGRKLFRLAGSSPVLCKAGNTLVGSIFLGFAGKLASL